MHIVNCAVILALGLVSSIWAAPGDTKTMPGDCIDFEKTMEPAKEAIASCLTSLKMTEADMIKSMEAYNNPNLDDKCFSRCFAWEMKYADKTHKVARPMVAALIKEKVTPEVKAKLVDAANACFDKFEKDAAAATADPASCKIYKEGHACVLNALKDNCKM